MSTKQLVPNGALRLVAEGCHAFADVGDNDEKSLNMTVYSGGVIKGHYWWGDLAIDLTGIKFDRSKYPVLENHRTDKKIGFSKKPLVTDKLELNPKTTKFVNTEASREFQQTSSDGFPYQASMYAIPSVIERVSDGEKVKVNGFTFKGPGTVWRKCLYQEASVCVFGWDTKTKSEAFSKEKVEVEYEEIGKEVVGGGTEQQLDNNNLESKEVKEMPLTLEKLTTEAPDLLKKIQDDALAAAETKFQAERDGFQTTIDGLTTDNAGMTDRVSKLEKADAKREDQEQKLRAEAIWQAQLAASDLPLKRHKKVREHVKFKGYLDADGKLDKVKFAEAVAAEIKDWEVDETASDDVIGGVAAFGRNDVDSDAQKKAALAKDNAARSNALLAKAGQPQKAAE